MKLTSVTSCCCFDLRTGALILGYLDLLPILFFPFTGNVQYQANELYKMREKRRKHIYSSYSSNDLDDDDMYAEELLRNVNALRNMFIVWALIGFVSAAAYLYGIHKNKPDFMLPHVIITFLRLGVWVLILGIGIIFSMVAMIVLLGMGEGAALLFLLCALFLFAVLALDWYLSMVYYSYYKVLKAGGVQGNGWAFTQPYAQPLQTYPNAQPVQLYPSAQPLQPYGNTTPYGPNTVYKAQPYNDGPV